MTTLALPSTAGIGLSRGVVELKQFFRQKEQVVFTFTFPAFILVLLGSIFDQAYPGGVTAGQVFAASMIGSGIVATSFLNLGIGVALDRDDGTLKRLRARRCPPRPTSSARWCWSRSRASPRWCCCWSSA